jgi:dihydropyrimidinase
MLPVLLTEGYAKERLSLEQALALVTRNPAKIFGLEKKGEISIGYDADLTLVDLDNIYKVGTKPLGFISNYSIYDGWDLKGWSLMTFLRGKLVMENRQILGRPGTGKFLKRS